MSTYSNYQNAYKKASVNTLDQNKLIIMLYDGAIKNANFAVQYMESGEIEKVHDSLIKTKNIVTELLATLNMEQGGEIAKNLKSLYSYMFSQLIEANMEKKTAFPNETEARASAPSNCPTIILSKRFTETCPTCVSITGRARVRHSLV